ncbi:MAG TPA: hypothetical protein ENI23_08500 [bacterium]|nr:hypothetical protein [bacterium]
MFLEDTDSTTDGGSGADENNKPTQEVQNTEGAPASEETKPGEGQQEKPIDTSAITAEQFKELLEKEEFQKVVLQSEPIKKTIQSEKDKEINRERRRLDDEARKRDAANEAQKKAEKRQSFIENEDYEGLGKLQAEDIEEAATLSKSATKVAKIIEDVVRKNPEFSVLGESRIDEIYNRVGDEKGNVVDFTIALSKERREVEVAAATELATKTIKDTIAEEIDAALVAAGVKERSEKAKGDDTPSEEISGASAPRKNIKSMTYDEASLAYGGGDISTDEFEPFRVKHEKERRY